MDKGRMAWGSLSSTLRLHDKGALIWQEVVGIGEGKRIYTFCEIGRSGRHVMMKDLSRNLTLRVGPRYVECVARHSRREEEKGTGKEGGGNGRGGVESVVGRVKASLEENKKSRKDVAAAEIIESRWHVLKGGRWVDRELDFTISERLSSTPPAYWSVSLVAALLESLHLSSHIPSFLASRVDGPTLLQLDEEDLRVDLGMKRGIERKRILGHVALYSERFKTTPACLQKTSSPLSGESSLSFLSNQSKEEEEGVMEMHKEETPSLQGEVGVSKQDEGQKKKVVNIFLSYSWSNQAAVLQLRKVIESHYKDSVRIWMDVSNMGGGDVLLAQIDEGVRRAHVIICCLSKQYALSSCCRKEVLLADSLGKPLLCVLMEAPARIPFPPLGPLGPVFAGRSFKTAYSR